MTLVKMSVKMVSPIVYRPPSIVYGPESIVWVLAHAASIRCLRE